MSDDISNLNTSTLPSLSEYLDRYERERMDNVRRWLPEFAQKFRAAGVARIVVSYDGSCDSGQIEDVEAFDSADQLVDLSKVVDVSESQLMDLFYDLTQARHPGWENNDGACGEFRWNLSIEELEHTHNDRIMEYDTTEHQGL